MADHRAEQIMDAVVTAVTGLTTTGANVQRGRVYPVDEAALPALSVYMSADEPLDGEDGQSVFGYVDSELTVRVEAHVKGSANIDQTLNQIRAEVYQALLADYQLGLAFVQQIIWRGADEPELDAADQKVGRQAFNWAVRYRHSAGDPTQ